jgi:hypothetical protein
MTANIIIIGATSGIAEALARRYAAQGAGIFLVARSAEKLAAICTDLSARGAYKVASCVLDANDTERMPEMLNTAWRAFDHFDVALVAHGTLPDQSRCETDLAYAIAEFQTNAQSVITCLAALANRFENQGTGVMAVIGSVAGDRGRGSNYLYGSAKAAIEAFTSGLRMRLFKSGVHVLLIKPGFVATAMTADLNLPALLTAAPETVAKDIQHAINKRKDVLYTPWFWSLIMWIIRWLPMAVFKRLKV